MGHRNIYIISNDPNLELDNCLVIDEKIFPFTIDNVAQFHGKLTRNGWYLQQLLKLYAGFIIPNILDRYLVIDSDTFFLKQTIFINDNKCLYAFGKEYHSPYFRHMKLLHPSLTRFNDSMSGICHHMMFEKKYLLELFTLVENFSTTNQKFYEIFLNSVAPNDYNDSGASEYEIYFNFILLYHFNDITIRQLMWKNVRSLNDKGNMDYISYHWYLR